MTSSISLKKLVSVGAALLLALGGGLATATPAQAAALNYVESNSFEPSNGQTPRAGGTLSNRIGDTTNVQTPPFDNAAHSRHSCRSLVLLRHGEKRSVNRFN
jgi:hypothetical protein